MRIWPAIVAAAAVWTSACATASPPEPGCDIVIAFGSYCCGTSSSSLEAIEQLIHHDPRVATASRRNSQGREGEFSYCIAAVSRPAAAALYRQLLPLIDTNEGGGQTTITGPHGRTHTHNPAH